MRSLSNLLISIPEVKDYIKDSVETDDFIYIDKFNFREIQLLIDDEIVLNGLDNQETVNKLGIDLYKLYDELSYQENNKW